MATLPGQAIQAAEFSVDSFFFMSGFLALFIGMKKLRSRKKCSLRSNKMSNIRRADQRKAILNRNKVTRKMKTSKESLRKTKGQNSMKNHLR